MSNVWAYSDPHFWHTACWEVFKNSDGTPLRPFTSTTEMNDALIKNYNDRVKADDTVIWLGDIIMEKESEDNFRYIMEKLNNSKRYLILGNHDKRDARLYLDYFDNIWPSGYQKYGFSWSHIPLHYGEGNVRGDANLHGHMHAHQVMKKSPFKDSCGNIMSGFEAIDVPDSRYLCVSVEHTDFAPIELNEIRKRVKERKEQYG